MLIRNLFDHPHSGATRMIARRLATAFLLSSWTTIAAMTTISSPGHAQALPEIAQAKPWLGVAIDAGKTGVLVKEVLPDTPAAQYGLKAGDEILAISGTKVKKPEELIAAVRSQGVGNSVKVDYLRDGKAASKDVKLVARPDELELVRKQVENKPAPKFSLERMSGDAPASMEKLKGKTVVMEFWATWCPACRSSHPRLSEYAKTARARGIEVIAVSDEEKSEIKSYVDQVKPGFTVLRDQDHFLHKELIVSAIPMLVVIDREGIMRFATIGAGSYLEEALAAADKLAVK